MYSRYHDEDMRKLQGGMDALRRHWREVLRQPDDANAQPLWSLEQEPDHEENDRQFRRLCRFLDETERPGE